MINHPPRVGIAMPQLNRYGGISAGATAAQTGAAQAATDADNVRWYESGPFWTLVFLFVGYVLVYRTIR